MNLLIKFIYLIFSLTLLTCSNFYDGFKAVEIDIGYEKYKQQRKEAKKRD